MEPMSSCDDGMDTKFASTRCKAKKAVLNRRPSGYWKVFSNWWRGRYATLKTRPTVHEVIEWYHRNAASSWPAGQVPCLKAVLRQSKGLRPIDGLKEYFREYRKKRKQQGGLALKAVEDGFGRRVRPAKRRRGRAAQRDSSDEDDMEELENEASGMSDQMASDDEDEAFAPEAEAEPAAHAAPCPAAAKGAPAAAIATCPVPAFQAEGFCLSHHPHLLPTAAHAVFSSWQQATPGQCMGGMDGGAPPSLPVGVIPVLDMDASPAGSGDPVHPVAASGMVPVSPSSSPSLPDLQQVPKHPVRLNFPGRPASPPPFTTVAVVPVRNSQPLRRLAMLRCCGAALRLPPLSAAAEAAAASRSAAAAEAASPRVQPKTQAEGEDHADDRCSTGGGVPPGGQACPRPYLRMPEGYDYASPYGPVPLPYYACHAQPHPACCYRPSSHCVLPPYPYRAGSYQLPPGCSGGGAASAGVSSSFASTVPWSRPPTEGGMHALPNRQPSIESPAELDGCYPRPWQPPCGPWGMFGPEGPWQGHPQGYGTDFTACGCVGRQAPPPHAARGAAACCPAGCLCGGRGEPAMYFGRAGPHMMPRSAFPMYVHPGAGHPLHGPMYPPEAWDVAPPAAREVKREGGDGEACSSSVSEHQQPASDAIPCKRQEPGRCTPCSGTSGASPFSHMHRPQQPYMGGIMYSHGYQYPPAYYPPYGPAICRGMVHAGSVTSVPSLAATAEESVFAAAAGVRGVLDGRGGVREPFVHHAPSGAARDAQAQGPGVPTVGEEAAASDADVTPFFNSGASNVATAGATLEGATGDQRLVIEGADCGLGVEEGFAVVARESMDQDLAFAWENFVACDATFDGGIACH